MGVYPSPVPTFHNATYPALSPHGRATGKVVVISGASGGIGRDVAMSFGKAGATKIVLLGRDQAKLVETRDAVLQIDGCEAEVHAFPVDLLDEVGMKRIAEDVGSWDVLVCSAGKGGRPKNVGDDVAGWWDVVETNIRGTLLTISSFLPRGNGSGNSKPTIINVSAGSFLVDPAREPSTGASAYNASKLATVKMIEHLSVERPDIVSISVHPGIVPTATFEQVRKTQPTEEDVIRLMAAGYIDQPGLAGDFMVWLSTIEAEWLSGKMVWANWDVEEMMQRKEQMSKKGWGVGVVGGWPFEYK